MNVWVRVRVESHLSNQRFSISVFDEDVPPQPFVIRPVRALWLRAANSWVLQVQTWPLMSYTHTVREQQQADRKVAVPQS